MRRFSNDRQVAELQISIGAVLTSVAFSIIHLVVDPLPNPDGVVYLLAAQAWLDDGYAAATAIFPLPLYSILIASWHAATGFELLTSAHWVDAALVAATIVGLQRLCGALGGDTRVQLIVVALALLLPELNGYRSFLLRDFGYWAFSTFALAALVRYAVAPTPLRAGGFVTMCGLAAGFRLEAVPLLLVMPMALLLGARQWRAVAMLYVPASLALVAAGFAIVLLPEAPIGIWLAKALRTGLALGGEIPDRIHAQLTGFGAHVLDPGFHDYAAFGLAGGLATMVVVHVVNAASLPLAAIAAIGLAKSGGAPGGMDRRTAPIVYTAFGVAVLGLAAILTARGIIQTRYAIAAALPILVIAAFAVEDWYVRLNGRRTRMRWLAALLGAYLIGEAGFGLLNSKQHYVDAADWLARNTPRAARIFSNDLRVVYLAGRPVDWRQAGRVDPSEAGTYDFWVVNAARGRVEVDEVAGARGLALVAQFKNSKGHALLIYRASSPTVDPAPDVDDAGATHERRRP